MRQYSEEEVIDRIQRLPEPLQDAVTGPEMAMAVAGIGSRAGLHIDQIGALAQMNRNMLLGLIRPEEFQQGLHEMGLAQETANNIIAQINEKIFKPLHDQVMNAARPLQDAPVSPPAASKASMPQYPQGASMGGQQAPVSPRPTVAVPSYGTDPSLAPQPVAQTAPPQVGVRQSAPVAPPQVAYQYAAPQPAPAYHAPAPLPPRSVMPGSMMQQSDGVSQVVAPARSEPVLAPRSAGPEPIHLQSPLPNGPRPTPVQPVYPQPPAIHYPPAQPDIPRQAEPPAPPPNLPGAYGPAPSYMTYAQPPAPAQTANHQYYQPQSAPPQAPEPAPQQPPAAYYAPAQPDIPRQAEPLRVYEPQAPAPQPMMPLEQPYIPQRAPMQPSAPAAQRPAPQPPASTDPYREPIG